MALAPQPSQSQDSKPRLARGLSPPSSSFVKLERPHSVVDWTSDGSVDRHPRRIASMHNSIPYARPREDDAEGRLILLSEAKKAAKKVAKMPLDDLIAKTLQGNSESPVEFNHGVPYLVAHLISILQDKQLYKKLVGCQSSGAQRLLDSFQQLLDSPDLTHHFRKSLSVAMHRLAARSGLYPACYELKDVVQEGEYPVNAGGFADIYKGKFQGHVVCLKAIRLYRTDQIEHMLKDRGLTTSLDLKATSKEAILWRQLLHPNVLTLFGLYRFQNRISIVTAWMENGDISAYLKKHPTAPRHRLATDVGNGLAYLHMNGIIHGDLKGPNILIDDTGRARLADFGISSVSDSQIVVWTTQSSDSTKAGGSIRWQAPELFAVGASDMDDEEVEAAVKNTMASDVYALACVFFESGARPARPPSSNLSWTEWGLTEDIWACIEDCWNGQPTERPPAAAVAKRLAAHLSEDMRQELDTDIHLPEEFRRRMSESFKMITVEELNDVLGTRLELTEHEVKDIIEQQPHSPTLGSNVSGGTLSEQMPNPSSQQRDEFFIHALNSQIAESNASEAFLPLPSGYSFTPHSASPAPNISLSAQSNISPTNLIRSLDLVQPTLSRASGNDRRSMLDEPRLRSEIGLSGQRTSPYPSPKVEGRTVDVIDLDEEENGRGMMGITDRPFVMTGRTATASARRRKQEAKFVCPIPGCGSTFTMRFNLKEGEGMGIGIGGDRSFISAVQIHFPEKDDNAPTSIPSIHCADASDPNLNTDDDDISVAP
ncbi:hypothetical protein DXG01_002186 [Tephrocybe rancida]|nr:hypothetical protein DXG01_002186 [Tephrocybe rancida]